MPRIGDPAPDFAVVTTQSGAMKVSEFVFDPRHAIRAIIYYPINAGRNADEAMRFVTALQMAERNA